MVKKEGFELTSQQASEYNKYQKEFADIEKKKEEEEERSRRERESTKQILSDVDTPFSEQDMESVRIKVGQQDFSEKLSKKDMDDFKKEIEKDATFSKRVGTKIDKKDDEIRQALKDEKARLRKTLGQTKKAKNIDPLKEFKKSMGPKTKRGPGRPRKYKPLPDYDRPVGRPPDRKFKFGGKNIWEKEPRRETRREPFIPPTKSQLLMMDMFGDKNQTWGFGGNPIRINNQLNSGAGITDPGDYGETASFFGMRRNRR